MVVLNKLKGIYDKNKVIFHNFSFITLLQIYLMLVPLITYPYLIRVLGAELYGYVITAQVIASYFSVIVDFSFKRVSAKHISIHREDPRMLSEIMSTVFFVRFILWIVSLVFFLGLICFVDVFEKHFLLFLFSFGITFNELLFPQFFYQGIEKMKSITFINIIIRTIFLVLIFIFVTEQKDYYYVPLFSAIGYLIGGGISFYIMKYKYHLSFIKPKKTKIKIYVKEALPLFYTSIICTIKDKFSYIIVANVIGMSEVTIYDLGSKLVRLISKPSGIISMVLFPRIAKDRDVKLFKKGMLISTGVTLMFVILVNVFLEYIVGFFMNESIDLFSIRLFLIAPIFLSIGGSISSNLMVAFGYNKYILYSIIITTVTYCSSLLVFYVFDYVTVSSMVMVAVIAYFTEFVYRLIKSKKIIENEKQIEGIV